MSLAPGQTFVDYEIVREIGRGGMGAVYEARQISLRRTVALKILPPHLAGDQQSAARFETEAVAAASLNHPNIVQVFSAGEHDKIRYIVMEFVEGESIQQRLKRLGRLPLTEALDVAYHIAVALDHAWQTTHVIHRDVKPDNIFLSTNGTVKLGDFGLAKFLFGDVQSATVTGHTMGSPHFISPEQAHGKPDIDFRADIYSLGCSLHSMATGRTVFEGPDFLSVMLKHVNDVPAPLYTLLPDCPASLDRLLKRMLTKDPAGRHASYVELIEQILTVRSEAATWETSDAGQRRRMAASSPSKSSRWVYAAGVAAVLITAVALVYGKRADRQMGLHHRVISLADPSDRRDFIASVRDLTAEERLNRVVSQLREVNPAFDGKVRYAVEDGAVTEMSFSVVGVTNLWPLCALPHLRVLRCTGKAANHQRSNFANLNPIAELDELEEIDLSWTAARDLRPISGLPLTALHCANTAVEDLSPLKGLALAELDISSTRVRDISALGGMPLVELRCTNTRVHDLAPLRGSPLKMLWCEPRLVPPDLLKSWNRLESINDKPVTDFLRRAK